MFLLLLNHLEGSLEGEGVTDALKATEKLINKNAAQGQGVECFGCCGKPRGKSR